VDYLIFEDRIEKKGEKSNIFKIEDWRKYTKEEMKAEME
jgi:hypothetical protein